MSQVEVRFNGLCVVVHRVGTPEAVIAALQPRRADLPGSVHDTVLAARVLDTNWQESSDPDFCVIDEQGHTAYWRLAGDVLADTDDGPDIDASALPGQAPDIMAQPDLMSLRWLPEYYGPSEATGVRPVTDWPADARFPITAGRVRSRKPSSRPTWHLQFTVEGRRLGVPREAASTISVGYESLHALSWGARKVVPREGASGVLFSVSNVSYRGGEDEDAIIEQMLVQPRPIRRAPKLGAMNPPLNPEVCFGGAILY